MSTFHIHIMGLVQGIGFRPHVYRIAKQMGLTGWVSNTRDGVHVEYNATEMVSRKFYSAIIQSPPPNAIITSSELSAALPQSFSSFDIRTDYHDTKPAILLTPDLAICDECRQEIMDKNSRRYLYPFTTCLHCGPRYSILTELPYDRQNTSMASLVQCEDCTAEYNDLADRRYFSQTNSCPDCAIPMHLYEGSRRLGDDDASLILKKLDEVLHNGSIVAIKGTGGYLLLCDATNESSLQQLRNRKHRPAKPFALLYPDIETAHADVYISEPEATELKDKAGPIVLCRLKPVAENGICTDSIAPGLDKIGLMLPSSPLLHLIATTFAKPLIATSANITNSVIIYKDTEALESLAGLADYIITYDREIMLPQDDSVLQITPAGKKIILRRSRGLAPNYFPNPFEDTGECVLATGAELKNAFALQGRQYLYVSQYLGNQENLTAQTAFTHTVNHLLNLLQTKPSVILADSHPGYFVTQQANEMALTENVPFLTIQHHKAHFGAVLAENNLLDSSEPILGVVWDGAGYGEDRQIWGGEFFTYSNNDMQRVVQFDYFPQLMGDKMNREPRLSALSLLKYFPSRQSVLEPHFSITEWQYYQQLVNTPAEILTSSAGRLLDGIASLLGICQVNSYEGEAVMKLETVARKYTGTLNDYYPIPLLNNRLDFSPLLHELLDDIGREEAVELLAKKVFYSLAMTISRVSAHYPIRQIAFSGGVFQNALLTDMIARLFAGKKKLYWHRQLSPNDECIGLGQLACYHSMQKNYIRATDLADSLR